MTCDARRLLPAAALGLVLLAGCGGGKAARVRGQVVENGQPASFAGMLAAVVFAPVGPDGKPDTNRSQTAVLNPDGSFELVASGGELPVGTYMVGIQVVGKAGAKFKDVGPTNSPIRRELKPGPNDLTIDVARPGD